MYDAMAQIVEAFLRSTVDANRLNKEIQMTEDPIRLCRLCRFLHSTTDVLFHHFYVYRLSGSYAHMSF